MHQVYSATIGLLSESHGIVPHHLQSLHVNNGAADRSMRHFIIERVSASIGSARPVRGGTGPNVCHGHLPRLSEVVASATAEERKKSDRFDGLGISSLILFFT
jgi:hypothetical protein